MMKLLLFVFLLVLLPATSQARQKGLGACWLSPAEVQLILSAIDKRQAQDKHELRVFTEVRMQLEKGIPINAASGETGVINGVLLTMGTPESVKLAQKLQAQCPHE